MIAAIWAEVMFSLSSLGVNVVVFFCLNRCNNFPACGEVSVMNVCKCLYAYVDVKDFYSSRYRD